MASNLLEMATCAKMPNKALTGSCPVKNSSLCPRMEKLSEHMELHNQNRMICEGSSLDAQVDSIRI